jgi:formylglycine-generating enzyme required for sulfatase activity
MIYANNQASIAFPTGTDDSGDATLTRKFFMAETETTNALAVEVLQWAYDNGRFSDSIYDHNGLDDTIAKYGEQTLLALDGADIKINYAAGSFTVDNGYENHPVVHVTWYGAIMFCNWLTEMKDGNTDNLVYSGIDTDWTEDETAEDAAKTGYRLPSSGEWEYTARYIGTNAPTVGNLASEYVAQSHNGGSASLTAGYYWTPGDYASGATKDTANETETRAVAWYAGMPGGDELKAAAGKAENQLGIRDMSGNAREWCFTADEFSISEHLIRGGSWDGASTDIRVGDEYCDDADREGNYLGFRLARTQ